MHHGTGQSSRTQRTSWPTLGCMPSMASRTRPSASVSRADVRVSCSIPRAGRPPSGQPPGLFRSKVRGRGFSWHLARLHSGVIIPIWPQEVSGAAS